MSALEICIRLALIGGSAGINLAGYLNVWISATLGLLALVTTAELAMRPYSASIFDRLLLIAGGLVAMFIVVGLVLNVTPWGLTIGTWNIAVALVGLVVLIWRRGTRTSLAILKLPNRIIILSIIGAGIIMLGAAALAVDGVAKSDTESVLSLSMVSSTSTDIGIQIGATSVSGNYEITAFSKEKDTSRYTSKPFSISAGRTDQIIQVQVPVRVAGTWVINLEALDSHKVLRQLLVNVNAR